MEFLTKQEVHNRAKEAVGMTGLYMRLFYMK